MVRMGRLESRWMEGRMDGRGMGVEERVEERFNGEAGKGERG